VNKGQRERVQAPAEPADGEASDRTGREHGSSPWPTGEGARVGGPPAGERARGGGPPAGERARGGGGPAGDRARGRQAGRTGKECGDEQSGEARDSP